jgi:hypothetical protein
MPRLTSATQRTVRPSTPAWRLAFGALLALPAIANAQGATPQTHSVRPGDTLWSLSQQFLGDPLLWPEIYRLNTDVVEDPHWIYPGEILRLAASEGVTAVPTQDTPAPNAADAQAQAPVARVDAVDDNVQVAVEDDDANYDANAPLFPQMGTRRNAVQETVRAYSQQNYRPIRRDEFYSAGFLTEGEKLPFGRVVGRVAPPMISSIRNYGVAKLYTELAVSPPKGATYEIGDSLMVVAKGDKVDDHGFMVLPTGIGVVRRIDKGRPIITMERLFWDVFPGQWILPLEKFPEQGRARAVPVADGIAGEVLAFQRREGMRLAQPIRTPQSYLYIDKGSAEGVALGDIFEVRRSSGGTMADGTVKTDELMAVVQVVHVREHHASAVILSVKYADLKAGVVAKQVAKLPS